MKWKCPPKDIIISFIEVLMNTIFIIFECLGIHIFIYNSHKSHRYYNTHFADKGAEVESTSPVDHMVAKWQRWNSSLVP